MSLVFAVIFDADIANGVNPTQTAKCCTVPLGDVLALSGVDAVSATMTVVNNLVGAVDFRKGPFKIRVYEAPEGFDSKAVSEPKTGPVSFTKEEIDALMNAKTPEEAAAAIGLGPDISVLFPDRISKLDEFMSNDSDSDGDVHEELGVSKA